MTQLASHRARNRRIDLAHGPVAVLDTLPAGRDSDARPHDGGPPTNGGRFHHGSQQRNGTGPHSDATALLVPGYTGSKEDFAPILDPLATSGFRIVAMDLPGQYESPGPDDPAGYSVGRLSAVVLDVVRSLGVGPVHLLGHSFGGLVARAAALADPGAFRSLTLLCSGPAAIGGPRQDRMTALEPYLPLGMTAVYEAVYELAKADPKYQNATPELRDFLRERFVTSSAAGLRGMGDALLGEPDRVGELAACPVPVLVAYGERDDAWQPRTQAAMATQLGAEHVVIPGAAHSPAIENTGATADALAAFWRATGVNEVY